MFKNHKHKIIAIAILTLLIAGTVGYVNYLINKPLDIPIPKHFTYNGQKIALAWTDDNTGEDLIIQSDKKEYNGFSSVDVYFSITNITKRNQEVDIKFIGDHIKLNHINHINPCKNKLAGINKINMIESGETNYYKATLGFAPMSKGEFFIEAIGNKGGYGFLDPWYSSSWKYRKEITINSSQVTAHLTDFPVLATTTDTDLKSTANGGKVALSTGYDIVFADTGGNVLNYEREKYDSATGEIAYWIKTDISSTTDKIIYMYYGNSGASDLATTTGVWDDNFVMVNHLAHDGVATTTYPDFNDSTKYNNDGSSKNMNSDDLVDGQIDGSLDFDGVGDYVDCGNGTNLNIIGDITISALIKPGDVTGYQMIATKSDGGWGGSQYELRTNGDDVEFLVTDGTVGDLGIAIYANVLTPGTWYHIVGVIYGSTNIKVYVNNIIGGTTDIFGTQSTTNERVAIAARKPNAIEYFYHGLIDEVRISNVARTAGWIETEYNNQVSVGDFMTFGAEESSALVKVNSPLTNKLTDGLVGHWTFNGQDMDWASTTAEALDRSGNSNNGNVIGATPAIGKVGQGLEFDGAGDYVDCGDIQNIASSATVMGWIKLDDKTADHGLAGMTEGFQFWMDNNGDSDRFGIAIWNGIGWTVMYGTTNPNLGEFYHIAFTDNGTITKLYVNGLQEGADLAMSIASDTNELLYLGSTNDGAKKHNGLIDEVRIYNRALSADEIGELYRAGAKRLGVNTTQVNKLTDGLVGHWTFNGQDMDWASTTAEALDRSGNSNNGDVIGATPAIGKVGQALDFDGVDDYVDAGSNASLEITGDLTLMAWIYRKDTGSGSLFDFSADSENEADNILYRVTINDDINPDEYQYINEYGSGTNEIVDLNRVSGNTPNNQWVHFVFIRNSTDLFIYEDGSQVGSGSFTNTPTGGTTSLLSIGKENTGSGTYFNGLIDEVRIYNRALSADEIGELYRAGARRMKLKR